MKNELEKALADRGTTLERSLKDLEKAAFPLQTDLEEVKLYRTNEDGFLFAAKANGNSVTVVDVTALVEPRLSVCQHLLGGPYLDLILSPDPHMGAPYMVAGGQCQRCGRWWFHQSNNTYQTHAKARAAMRVYEQTGTFPTPQDDIPTSGN